MADGRVTFGMRLPDCGHQAPVLIAADRGYYADERLDVRVVVTEQLAPGLLDGTLDLADMPSTEVLLGATNGVPVRLVAGWHGVRDYWIAVGTGVREPADLAGRKVILGAPSDARVRRHLLAEAGFDLTGVAVEATNPPGGSDVWVAQLLAGEVGLAPVFLRHRAAVEQEGGRLVLDVSKRWPSNSVAATVDYLDRHGDTVTGFLRATLRAMRIWMDPSNQDYVLNVWRRNGMEIGGEQLKNYQDGFLRPYGRADLSLRAEEFAELVRGGGLLPEPPPFGAYTDMRFLAAAQESLETAAG